MCEGKGSFLTNLIVLFILFLSWITIVFEIKGIFFKIELFLILLFLIISVILMYGVGTCKRWAWSGLLVFYGINAINLLVVYFRTYVFLDIILPIVVVGLGYLVALIKLEPEEDFEVESYEDPKVEETKEDKKTASSPKKTAKKKTTKKKPAKKSKAKKKPTKKKK